MQLVVPLDPLFRVDEVALGYDQERDLLLLQVAEGGSEDDRQQVIFGSPARRCAGLRSGRLNWQAAADLTLCSQRKLVATASATATTVTNPD